MKIAFNLRGLIVAFICLAPALSLADGVWRMSKVVYSKWSGGNVQVKWNSATAESFHVVALSASYQTTLQNLAWTAIAAPTGGWKSGPNYEGRFTIRPHVVFGHNPNGYDTLAPRRHGVFMLDTYTGAAYVMTRNDGGTSIPNFPYDAVFTPAYWTAIQEAADMPIPPSSEIGRYDLSAVNAASGLLPGVGGVPGALGPYVMRTDRINGRVDVAIPKLLLDITSSVVDFVWYPYLQ